MKKHFLTGLKPLNRISASGFSKNSRFSKANLAVFALIFAGIGGYVLYKSFAASVTLTVDGNTKFQSMSGFGVSINADSWDNGNLKPALDMLVDQQGSQMYRVIIEMTDWESANDDSNSNNYNWNYYNPIYSGATSFDTNLYGANFANLWNTIDYLHQKGIPDSQICLSFMGIGPSWLGGTTVNAANEDEWAEMVTSAAYYGYSHGHTFGIFSPNNEEDWGHNEGIIMSSSVYAAAMDKVATRLDALGMNNVRLLGPETSSTSSAYMDAMAGFPNLLSKVDHFDSHSYSGGTGSLQSLSNGHGKDGWISEMSIFDQAFSLLGENVSGVMMWDAYDAIYNHAVLNGLGTQPGNDQGNAPPLIAYNSSSKIYTPRQSFYQFGQLYKYVPIGSVRIGDTSSLAGVKTVAFTHAASGRLTIVGENTTASSQTLTISLSNITNMPSSLSYYQTNSTSNMAQGSNVAVNGGTATVTVPASTVFTLTGTGITDTTPPSAPTNLTAIGSIGSSSLSWSASTDNVGVSQYNIYRSTTSGFTPSAANKIGQTAGTTYNDSGLSSGTYYYAVTAQDASGNVSSASIQANDTVTADTTAPTASISSPTNGTTISGTVTVSANASDNVGVAGVQFKLDGANIGSEDTSNPYSISWDSSGSSNGTHTLTAVARDASGNSTTSSNVTVTITNTTTLIGTQTIQGTSDSNVAGDAEAFKYTATNSGTTGSISFYVSGGSGATSLKLGVYSDNAGHPGTLLTSATVPAVSSLNWNSATLSPAISVTSGTAYWIGFLGTGGSLAYRDLSSGNCSESPSSSGLTNLPSTWTSGSTWPSCSVSAYVSAASGGAAKVGDINNDGSVNIFDLSILLSNYNSTNAAADLNNDGIVNIFDLSILLSHYGT